MGHGSAQFIASKAEIGALEPVDKVAVIASDGEGARVGHLVHGHTQLLFGFEVDTIMSPTELHFRFAAGLTLEAYVICGEDNQAPWRLFHDDRWLH